MSGIGGISFCFAGESKEDFAKNLIRILNPDRKFETDLNSVCINITQNPMLRRANPAHFTGGCPAKYAPGGLMSPLNLKTQTGF